MNNLIYRIIKKSRILPLKTFIKLHYRHFTGKKLNLSNPINFNEKIQWLKVYYRLPLLTQLVDKFEVRDYVSKTIGDQYLNTIYGVYENENEIDFEKLPNRFVLKATHGYNMNLVVKDKAKLDISKARSIANRWLRWNHYNSGMEWAYKNVKPRIIAEKFLQEEDKPYITDYKFFCFNGKPRFLQVDRDRYGKHSRLFYDLEWNKLPFTKSGITSLDESIERPQNFEKMIALATDLAKNLLFVRVDLYNLSGVILFGEMTFYPADGRSDFEPAEYNTIIGNYLKLPKIPKGLKKITNFDTIFDTGVIPTN